MTFDIHADHVTINGIDRVNRPSWIAVSRWIDFWERVQLIALDRRL